MLARLYHIKSASLKLANSKEERDTSKCVTSGEASVECVVELYHLNDTAAKQGLTRKGGLFVLWRGTRWSSGIGTK